MKGRPRHDSYTKCPGILDPQEQAKRNLPPKVKRLLKDFKAYRDFNEKIDSRVAVRKLYQYSQQGQAPEENRDIIAENSDLKDRMKKLKSELSSALVHLEQCAGCKDSETTHHLVHSLKGLVRVKT